MENPFGAEDLAAGYATSRPAVHPRVIERAYRQLGRIEPFLIALDIGCGAGVSTKALTGFAQACFGLDPVEPMLRRAGKVAPDAHFLAGAAEAIPFRDHSVDLITAAGSLNYVELDLFFPEAVRVLREGGVLLVYDFSPGRSFPEGQALDQWFSDFSIRYPAPPHEARNLSPEILADLDSGLRPLCHEHFEIGLTLTLPFYIDYIMTETNVAAAVRGGASRSDIRSWCAETLSSIWNRPDREVLFRGYFACMSVA